MEIEVRLQQFQEMNAKFDEVITKINELLAAINDVHMISADTASDVELCVKTLLTVDTKLNATVLSAAAPTPTAQPEASEQPKEAPLPKRRRRVMSVAHVGSEVVEPASGANGEVHESIEDEDALRARAAFEGKRIARTLGIGAMRAAVKKIAGDGILQIDDVPAWQLMTLLAELQAI